MTNTKKKKNNTKKLLGAVGMLSISAAMLVSSTFAWFTMNKDVKAQNMTVKAKAEGGLLISEVAATSGVWDDVANSVAEVDTNVALYPTSTANSRAWYHATSKTANDAAAATAGQASGNKSAGYTELSLTANTLKSAVSGENGLKEVYFSDTNTATSGYDADDAKYYVKYTYYLKTSSEGTTTLGTANGSQNVNISEVTATGSSSSPELDKALRIGIEMGGKFYIFRPIAGATGTYYVNASSTSTTAIDSSSSATTPMTEVTALSSLPGVSDPGTPVYVYMWYEGEDAACKSDNIAATLDTMTVNVTFSLVNLTAAGTDHGVTISTT